MEESQKQPASPTAHLDRGKENALHRHRIALFMEKLLPLKSLLKDRVRMVKETIAYSVGNKKVKRFVFARA